MEKILITGGAGFVGSHLADELLMRGYEVRVLDNPSPQVHQKGRRPSYLSKEVELGVGDAMRKVNSAWHNTRFALGEAGITTWH